MIVVCGLGSYRVNPLLGDTYGIAATGRHYA